MFRTATTTCLVVCALAATLDTARAAGIEGFTEPYRSVDLAPAEPGTLARVLVQEGEQVRANQLLAELECDVLTVSLEIARANAESHGSIDAATAELDLRRRRLEKFQELRARGHCSQDELDRALTDFEIAQASLVAAQEKRAIDALEAKRTLAMIERRRVRSPFDGVATRVYREPGEFITSNAPHVITVVQLDLLRVIFSIPSAQRVNLREGQTVRVEFPEHGGRAEGRVEFVSPVTDAESGTIRVKIVLENPQGEYPSGARCLLEAPVADGVDAPLTRMNR